MKHGIFLLSLPLLLLTFALCGGETVLVRHDLELPDDSPMVRCDGLFVPAAEFGTDPEGRIIIEAETPAEWESAKRPAAQENFVTDQTASGKTAARHLKRASYRFQTKRSGKFRLWYRAKFPAAGNWFHTEYLDDAEKKHVCQDFERAQPKKANVWTWVRGEVQTLGAGSHQLVLDWQGGAQLDQIALLPENVEPASSESFQAFTLRRRSPLEVILKPFTLPEKESFAKLLVTPEGAPGSRIEAFFSSNGKDFKPFPETWKTPPRTGTIKLKIFAAPNGSFPSLVQPAILAKKEADDFAPEIAEMIQNVSDVELIPESWKGMRLKEGRWQLTSPVIPDENQTLWFDALSADHTVLAPRNNSFFQEDAEAFHGRALYCGVLNRNLLSFDCKITQSGEYRPWFRVKLLSNAKRYKTGITVLGKTFSVDMPYIPLMYQFDNGTPVEFAGEKTFPKEEFLKSQWVWIPAPKVTLNADDHVFRLRAGLDYMLFDRVALVPEKSGFTPSGKGNPSRREQNLTGEIVFQKMASGSPVGALTANKTENLQVSWFGSERKRQWTPLKTGDELPAWSKAVFTRQKSDAPAAAADFHLKLSLPRRFLRFDCGHQQLWFDPLRGELTGWCNPSGQWLIPLGAPQGSPFKLTSEKNGGTQQISKRNVRFEFSGFRRQGDALKLDYRAREAKIGVTVTISPAQDGLADWKIDVDNASSLELRNVEFPKIADVRVASDPETVCAVATQPNFGGVDFTGAPLEIASPGKAFSGFASSFSGTYPGWFAMGWSAFYTDEGSFTVQSRNPDAIAIHFGSSAGNNAIHSTLTRRIYIAPGEKTCATYALGWQPGDWHVSADSYSRWAHSWMDFSRINANWIAQADGWVSCSFYYDSAYVPTRFATHLVPELRWMGANHFQMFYGCFDNTPGPATYPLPNLKLGSMAEFKAGFTAAQKQGIHMTSYCDARGWNDDYCDSILMGRSPRALLPDNAVVPERGFGAANATMRENGSLMGFGYLPGDYSLCAASKPWQDHLVRALVHNLAEQTGSSMYHDEANFYGDCYNAAHTHGKQHGMHMQGLVEVYKKALDEGRKYCPEMVIAIEGCPDVLAQCADVLLFGLSGYANGTAYQYVYPEAKLYRGISNPGAEWFMTLEEYTRYVHLFNRLDSHPDSKNSRNFFAHRRRIRHWIYGRRFMDEEKLTLTKPGIAAKWFKTDGPEGVAALVNVQNEMEIKGAEGILLWDKLKGSFTAAAYLFDEENAIALPFSKIDGGVRFAIPEAKASSILFVVRTPENRQLECSLVWPQEKGADKLRLIVNNLTPEIQTANLQWQLPENVTLKEAPGQVALAPGITVMEVAMSGRAQMEAPADAGVEISAGKVKYRTETMLLPLVQNGGFEKDSSGKGTPDHWRAFGYYWKHLLMRQPVMWFDINHADGVLDPVNPASGKYSLKLPGRILVPFFGNTILESTRPIEEKSIPLQPWYFHTGQRFIGKPGVRYRISCKYRFADDSGVLEIRTAAPGKVYGTAYLKRFTAIKGDRQWHEGSFIHVLDEKTKEHLLVFANMSGAPLWIDDVKIEEIAE